PSSSKPVRSIGSIPPSRLLPRGSTSGWWGCKSGSGQSSRWPSSAKATPLQSKRVIAGWRDIKAPARANRPVRPPWWSLVQPGEKKDPFCVRPEWAIMTPDAQTTLLQRRGDDYARPQASCRATLGGGAPHIAPHDTCAQAPPTSEFPRPCDPPLSGGAHGTRG